MSSSSSSSSRLFLKKYDVFISFRGEDTRENFTDDLYSALEKENILTYIDYQLERGDDIWPALVKAIKDSVIAIVVFSENYATSKWCLQELAQIMECKRVKGQVVIPVFYKTNPTDVRKQTGSYKKPFEDYDRAAAAALCDERHQKNKVNSWRDALTQAANISGWESCTHRDYDSQVIRNIVNDVLQKLRSLHYDYEQGLVGIEEQCKAVEGLSGKLGRRIGVWGMGGTGKTTMAKALFDRHSPQYDSACFLKDVREESQIHGLTHIHDELLSELLKEAGISSELSTRKVLIVLDDVDSSEQLESLFVGLGELGEGSSLIITSRDRHLLRGIVDEIHELKPWDFEKSLVLFSIAAFKKSQPDNAYEDVSQRAVEYAGGLPFVLKFLGSYFYSKNLKFWESALLELENGKKQFFKEFQDMLKVNYHGLSRQEQAIFLDIAFFIKDRDEDFVLSILNACGFNATSGIEKLKDKALITISNSNTIQMHDLIQRMALEIIRNDVTDPGRGSRLSSVQQVRDVLANDKGTPEVVEVIVIDSSRRHGTINAGIFNLPKLRILKVYIPAGKDQSSTLWINDDYHLHEQGSAELKYLHWSRFTLKSLPSNFCAKFLVELRMPDSDVKTLWEGTQELVNLETIDLTGCEYLECLPDLSKASKLKWVYLSGCGKLSVVDLSSSEKLVTLMVDKCWNLKILKCENHLREFSFYPRWYKLEEFSASADSIERLDFSGRELKKLYPSIGRLRRLVWLNIDGLKLQNLPNELSCLTSLEELRISNCRAIDKEKLHVLCAGLRSLKVLHLRACEELFELPDNISALSSLHELRLQRNFHLKKLPTSIKLLEKLEILSLGSCYYLEFLPELPLSIKELSVFNILGLKEVSTLKTFSAKMIGKEKHILFMGDFRRLNESSVLQIMEDAMFAMERAELHNVFVKRYCLDAHSYNYNTTVKLCLPQSHIPAGSGQGSLFPYRTKGPSITIESHEASLSHWLGTIYSVVLSGSSAIQRRLKIQCRIYSSDDNFGRREYKTTGYGNDTLEHHILKSNPHVFIWHGPSFDGAKVFEFFVTSDDSGENNDPIEIIECGIHRMCFFNSELQSFLGEADFEPEIKSELQSALDLRGWDET